MKIAQSVTELIDAEWLVEHVSQTVLPGLDQGVARVVAEPCHQDHASGRLGQPKGAVDLVTRQVRQADVGDDGIVACQPGHGQRLLTVSGCLYYPSPSADQLLRRSPNSVVVVHHQHTHALEHWRGWLTHGSRAGSVSGRRRQVLADLEDALLDQPGVRH